MLIPPIGTRGAFQLLTPFSTLIDGTTSYECKAVRRFVDLIHDGIDPFSQYYTPLNIASTKYDQDYAAGACMVSLVSDAGNWVHVPTTYINSYPNLGGIPYTAVVLGISLGAIPDDLDLTAVKAAIVDVVHDYIGVTSSVTSGKVSETQNLSYSDASSIEAARQLNISATTTDRAKLLAAQALNATLQQQLTALQNYIKTNLPPAPTPSPAPSPSPTPAPSPPAPSPAPAPNP